MPPRHRALDARPGVDERGAGHAGVRTDIGPVLDAAAVRDDPASVRMAMGRDRVGDAVVGEVEALDG